MEAYFIDLIEVVEEHINKCQTHLKIAVSWITHKQLFCQILLKLEEGVLIELIVNNDYINNRKGGIPLQEFVDKGGKLFFFQERGLMHNKFLIRDNQTVVNGSFNWTYQAASLNCENLLVIDTGKIVMKFDKEFEKIKEQCKKVTKIKVNRRPEKHQELAILLEEKNYENKETLSKSLAQLNNRIITGWIVKPGKQAFLWSNCIQEGIHRFGFDRATELLEDLNHSTRSELKSIYRTAYPEFKRENSHIIDKYLNRVDIGDIFFAAKGRSSIIGIGIVKSEARRYDDELYKTYREVEWIASFEEKIIELDEIVSMDAISELVINSENENWKTIKDACA